MTSFFELTRIVLGNTPYELTSPALDELSHALTLSLASAAVEQGDAQEQGDDHRIGSLASLPAPSAMSTISSSMARLARAAPRPFAAYWLTATAFGAVPALTSFLITELTITVEASAVNSRLFGLVGAYLCLTLLQSGAQYLMAHSFSVGMAAASADGVRQIASRIMSLGHYEWAQISKGSVHTIYSSDLSIVQ